MSLYDELTQACSKEVTLRYSTSFFRAVSLLSPVIRQDIHNIYGFVRFADEIVDTFHKYNQEKLLNQFEKDFYQSLKDGISLNPVLNSFQKTILKYLNGLENIYPGEIKGFLRNLHSELKKFEDDPYEKRAFLYLDIISWLESKISNKPVAVIIKEKALLINRKEKQTIALI